MKRDYGENKGTVTQVIYEPDGPRLVSPADPYIKRMFEVEFTAPFDATMLATLALRHDPGSIDANVFLAYRAKTQELRMRHLRTAVDIGDALFREVADFYGADMDWWQFKATRPYMIAIFALGEAHAEVGNTDAARWCFERLLRMNPQDNQMVQRQLYNLTPAENIYTAELPRIR